MSDPVPFRPHAPGTQPPLDVPAYQGTRKRRPSLPLHPIPHGATETTGPVFARERFPAMQDMTTQAKGAPIGERIVVGGCVTDEDGRAVPHSMIEIWQANGAGRYDHEADNHDAPLDPNFHGTGRVFTDAEGFYRFVTIRPGAYPWPNGPNAWRATHIHFSLFGPAFATRLVTQMYFPGDPLLATDPIFHGVPDQRARARLIAGFAPDLGVENWALGYRFDIVLRGRGATPVEH